MAQEANIGFGKIAKQFLWVSHLLTKNGVIHTFRDISMLIDEGESQSPSYPEKNKMEKHNWYSSTSQEHIVR